MGWGGEESCLRYQAMGRRDGLHGRRPFMIHIGSMILKDGLL